MAYIVVLNPLILGFAPDVDGNFLGGGAEPAATSPAIAAGTALVAGVLTILMGVVANYPLALATGLGLNAFVAFAIASQMTWADAMGLVVIEGLVILVLVLTGFRTAVFHAIPAQLKVAISVGIGLFIALIGFVDAGFVRRTGRRPTVPVQLGPTGQLQRLAGARLRVRPAARHRAVGAQGQGRDPDLDRRDDASSRSSSRRSATSARRRRTVNPEGWALTVPALPDDLAGAPRTSARSASSACSARSRRPAS